MIAGCYARKSTDEADRSEDAKSVTRQVERARQFAKARGWVFSDEHVYSDDGISGAEFKRRPGLAKMVAALEPKPKFEVLVVSEISRLGRDTIRTLSLIQQLQDAGVRIHSYLDDREVSVDSDLGEIEQFMKSYAASTERRKASQRTSDALRLRASQGKSTGGTTYGYKNGKVYEPEARVVRRVFKLRAQDLGYQRIARALEHGGILTPKGTKTWRISLISHWLHNEKYAGVKVYGKTRQVRKGGTSQTIESPIPPSRTEYPAIIDAKLWKAVQEVNARRARERSGPTGTSLLTQSLKCGLCGKNMSINQGYGGKPYYACSGRKSEGKARCPNSRAVLVERADKALIQKFEEALTDHLIEAEVEQFLHHFEPVDTKPLLTEQARIQAEIARLTEAYATGALPGAPTKPLLERNARLEKIEAELKQASLLRGPQTKIWKPIGRQGDTKAGVYLTGRLKDGKEFLRRIRSLRDEWIAKIQANPLEAKVVLRKLLPNRLTVTPTAKGGFRLDGFVRYTEVLKEAGYETLALVIEETASKLSKTRAWAG